MGLYLPVMGANYVKLRMVCHCFTKRILRKRGMRCTKSTDFQELFGPRSSGDNLGENSVVELATTTATAATTAAAATTTTATAATTAAAATTTTTATLTTTTTTTTTSSMPPIVHSHSSTLQYGKSSFFVGKSSIHGHVQ